MPYSTAGGANITTPGQIADGVITNAHINASAAIAYSKLSLALGIVNADIATNAAIVYSKLSLALGIVNADIATNAAIVKSKIATASAWVAADLPSVTQVGTANTSTQFSTTSTTFVDVTNLSITLTTGNNPTLVGATIPFRSSGGLMEFNILEDSTERAHMDSQDSNAQDSGRSMTYEFTPTAAAHTWKVQTKTSSGTLTIATTLTSTIASLFVIEHIK